MRLICLVLALLLGAGTAGLLLPNAAQAKVAKLSPDYESWERLANRAEEVIEAGRASTAALETMRTQLVEWREKFVAAQSINSNAIATVEAQLNALGPVPESGEEEESIAASRTQLNERLTQLRTPRRLAELAQSRADGLIRGIDSIIRERQAKELLELGPSPLMPKNWPAGMNALRATSSTVSSEIRAAWKSPLQRAEFKEQLPFVILLGALGLVLVARGRRWSKRAYNWAMTEDAGPLRWLGAFALSLGSVLVPYLGLLALIEAAFATNLIGLRGGQIIGSAPGPIFAFLLASWLAMRIFPNREARTLPLNLDAGQRRAGRLYGSLLALFATSYSLIDSVSEVSGWTDAGVNVLLFPFLVVAGLLLLRLARILQQHCRRELAEEGEESFRDSIFRFVALAMAVLGVVSPLLAAVGYFDLAHFLMFPSLISLAILAALLILQRLVVEIYVAITKDRDGAVDSLVPVMIGVALVLLSLPFFALAWGMRGAELWDLWRRFTEGFTLGGMRLSPKVLLTFAIVFGLGYTATRVLQGSLRNTILPKTRLDQGGRTAIVSGTGYVGIFIAALIAITSAGIDLSSLAIVAGALSVGIGFGLQTIVSNFVSGIILLIERPISEGDWIEVGGVHGTVRSISVRSTRIETFDRSDVIVPNTDLIAGSVTNYTRSNTVGRVIVKVGVAYGTDTQSVEGILREIAEEHPLVLLDPPPAILFQGFGADSLDFEIRAILRDVNWMVSVRSDMNHDIARRFAEEGIEIPFAQRDVWLRNPEVLRQQDSAAPAPATVEPTAELEEAPDTAERRFRADHEDGGGDADGGGR